MGPNLISLTRLSIKNISVIDPAYPTVDSELKTLFAYWIMCPAQNSVMDRDSLAASASEMCPTRSIDRCSSNFPAIVMLQLLWPLSNFQ